MEKQTTEKQMPKTTIRAGGVKATIWENVNKDNQVYHSVVIERSYKDKEDKWQTTNSYRVQDLPKLIAILQKTFNELTLKETKPEELVITQADQETL